MPHQPTYLELCGSRTRAQEAVRDAQEAVAAATTHAAQIAAPRTHSREHLDALASRVVTVKREIAEAQEQVDAAAKAAAACGRQVEQFREWQSDLVRNQRRVGARASCG